MRYLEIPAHENFQQDMHMFSGIPGGTKGVKIFLVGHITGYNLMVQAMNPIYLLFFLYPVSS